MQQRRDIADDLDAVRPEAGKLAGIAADHGGARRLHGAGQRQALGRGDGMDERAAHAPAGAGDHHPHVGHWPQPSQASVAAGYSAASLGSGDAARHLGLRAVVALDDDEIDRRCAAAAP